jgi:hypothetical protein
LGYPWHDCLARIYGPASYAVLLKTDSWRDLQGCSDSFFISELALLYFSGRNEGKIGICALIVLQSDWVLMGHGTRQSTNSHLQYRRNSVAIWDSLRCAHDDDVLFRDSIAWCGCLFSLLYRNNLARRFTQPRVVHPYIWLHVHEFSVLSSDLHSEARNGGSPSWSLRWVMPKHSHS